MKLNVSMTKNANKVVLELLPSIQAIFQLGFIPSNNEIVELDEETYEAFERQMGETVTGRLYTIQPTNPKYEQIDKDTGKKVMNIIRDDEFNKLRMGVKFFEKYARDNNIATGGSDFILKHAAKNLPSTLTKDSPFEQPKLKLLNSSKAKRTDQEEMMNFVYSLMEEEDRISFEIIDEKGVVREEAFSPTAAKAFDGDKMSFDEFKVYIMQCLSKIFADEKYKVIEDLRFTADNTAYEVIRIETKNEFGVTFGNGFRVSPFYHDYSIGKPIDGIIEEMLEVIEDGGQLEGQFNELAKLDSFESMKDRLIVRPLNYQANKETLKDYLYRVNGDIAIVIYTTIETAGNDDAFVTAKIAKVSIDKWGITEDEVFDWALQNTRDKYKPFIIPMGDIVAGTKVSDVEKFPSKNKYFMDEDFELKKSFNHAYMLRLEVNPNSSTAVFLTGVSKRLSEVLNDDLYFVLTSTNFSIIHTKSQHKLKDVLEMAENDRKSAYADKENFLSEGIYYYDRNKDTLEHLK